MARRKGAVTYKNNVLIKIVGKLLPNGMAGRRLQMHIRLRQRRRPFAKWQTWRITGWGFYATIWRSRLVERGRTMIGFIGAWRLKKNYEKNLFGDDVTIIATIHRILVNIIVRALGSNSIVNIIWLRRDRLSSPPRNAKSTMVYGCLFECRRVAFLGVAMSPYSWREEEMGITSECSMSKL